MYAAIASLGGYVADENGNFDWAAPGADVHAFVNDLERMAGTYLLGRRMYEVLAAWDSDDIVVFRIDPDSGRLTRMGQRIQVPVPVCIDMTLIPESSK